MCFWCHCDFYVIQKVIFCLIYYLQIHYLRFIFIINIHLTSISLLNLHIFKLHQNLFFCCRCLFFKSLSKKNFFQFSTITVTVIINICFYFLSDLSQLFRYLRQLPIIVKTKLFSYNSISSTHSKNRATKIKKTSPKLSKKHYQALCSTGSWFCGNI